MSRLGPWQPESVEERLDRMESLAMIRQLAYRYALSLDSRNMDALVELFVPDVQVAKEEYGREALRRWFVETMRVPGVSVHLIGNHIIDFEDADNARGIVYCRDELERPTSGEWEIGTIQYWDTYRRVDGEWYFVARKFHRWYLVDALARPAHGAGVNRPGEPLFARQLPQAFPSWDQFWQQP